MRRIWIIIGIIIVLGVSGYGYLQYEQAQQTAQQAADAAEAQQTDDLANVIWASGELTPITWAGLSPAITGLVSRLHVSEGDWVEAEQLLLEVNNDVLQSQVVIAEAALHEAEAALAKLQAGSTSAEITAARAQVAAAEAQVALAAGSMIELQAAIEAATAQVTQAQRQYAELASHPTQAENTVALANIAVAQAGVSQAQAAYNLVRGDPQLAARPEALTLMQMTASLEAAKAEAALVTEGATPQQLAVLAAAIDAARAQVVMAQSRVPGVEAGVKAAIAEKEGAQAALDRLLQGATAEEVAIAGAAVQSAWAALASAQAQLAQSQILAPFAGQVGTISVRLGEQATPGEFALLLGDTRQMHVETTDLRETDVVRLNVGMSVEVTFDALPDQFFAGKITHIAPMSTAAQGSTNYAVQIDVTDLDETLRWGMTAFVNIQAER